MIRRIAATVVAMTLVRCALADSGKFSQVVRPDDYSAAGLSKLSPEELARLDQLVEAYKSGALEAAQQQAAAASAAQAAAEARAVKAEADAKAAKETAEKAKKEIAAHAAAEKKASEGGFFFRARALVSPGTEIEYQPMESRIVGKINGWEQHSVFLLENGQSWQVADYTHYFNGRSVENPKVTITPAGVMGGFRMKIEGIGEMRVHLLSNAAPK